MTGLIAGSMALIVVSAVTLVFGWIGATQALIYASILCSVAAAVMLALAFYKSRTAGPPPPRSPKRRVS